MPHFLPSVKLNFEKATQVAQKRMQESPWGRKLHANHLGTSCVILKTRRESKVLRDTSEKPASSRWANVEAAATLE